MIIDLKNWNQSSTYDIMTCLVYYLVAVTTSLSDKMSLSAQKDLFLLSNLSYQLMSLYCLIPYSLSTLPLFLLISVLLPLLYFAVSTFSIYWVISDQFTLTTLSELAVILIWQLADLTDQDYSYSQKLHLSDWILIDTITNVSQKSDSLSLLTSILSQFEYNDTVWHLWNWTKEYWKVINFHQVLLNANVPEIEDEQHSHSFDCVKVNTGQESISLSSNQSTSNQSEEHHPFRSTEEISWSSLSQHQFSDSEPASLHTGMNMSWDEIQNMIQVTVTAALVINQQSEWDSQSFQDSLNESGESDEVINSTHWKTSEIDLFYLNLPLHEGDDDIVDKDNKIYYWNVHAFMNWVHVAVFIRNVSLIQKNLNFCLWDEAELWWNNQLDKVTQLRLIAHSNRVEEWCKTLKKQFCSSSSEA